MASPFFYLLVGKGNTIPLSLPPQIGDESEGSSLPPSFISPIGAPPPFPSILNEKIFSFPEQPYIPLPLPLPLFLFS